MRHLAIATVEQGKPVEAIQLLREAVQVATVANDAHELAYGLGQLGSVIVRAGDIEEGRAFLQRAVSVGRGVNDGGALTMALLDLGWLATYEHRLGEAVLAAHL